MTRQMMDLKNIQEATEVKRSGFKTKIHASAHKDEIDTWIIDNRWSSKMIVNELKRKYPNDNHPSDRGIDNYRHKYLQEEILKNGRSTPLTAKIIERLKLQFDPALEGVKLWQFNCKMIGIADELMKTTKVVPAFCITLLKTAGETYKVLCDEWARLGFTKSVPQEINLTEKRIYEPEDISKSIDRIIELRAAVRDAERRTKEGTIESPALVGSGDTKDGEGEVVVKHGPDESGNLGLQEPSAH